MDNQTRCEYSATQAKLSWSLSLSWAIMLPMLFWSLSLIWAVWMYFLIQIHWCDQNHLWTSSLESGRSSMDPESKEDQIYFWQFLSYRKVWYINFYVLWETNPIVSWKSLMDIILGIRKILYGLGRVPQKWRDLLLYIVELQRSLIYQF